ncbi:MAG: hypothetical protein HQ465_27430 [Rhodospirillales bacterium]|nr:hypothetical protein [Rhodospirillales bacterium]
MQRKLLMVVVAAATASGCITGADVSQGPGPVIWTASFNAQFDAMANCLARLYASEYTAVPQINQREQRANVVLTFPQGSAVMGEFQIRQANPSTSEISWRTIGGTPQRPGSSRQARERVERCERGGT